ncbi:MAG: exodeoxyribonuclease VII large subunit [Akkermansia sp.]|nr:exodeoxyribonuclease VII large subunit [Akkermansia sp.]
MPLSVTELVCRLKQTVEVNVGEQCVVGEIGSCKAASSGHIYFTLKDAHCQLQCALYAFRARSMRLRLREGMLVELRGKATVWEGRGSLQFIVDSVKEAGVGTLQQQFEALKARLAAEGLFAPARKRPIPRFPQSVALVTSATGAVIQDMRHRLEQRAPWIRTYLYPVQVQGKGAELGIARALEQLGNPGRYGMPAVDYIIIARGGGSLEDLWCFNEEVLARAIAACPVPVVSAVGHETDFTIADFVADLRAPTPTAAIELTTPDAAELRAWLAGTALHLRQQLTRSIQMARLRLKVVQQSRLGTPRELLVPHQQRLDTLTEELHTALHTRLQQERTRLNLCAARLSAPSVLSHIHHAADRLARQKQLLLTSLHNRLGTQRARLETLAARLSAASPQNALDRGFALVSTTDGRLARDAAALHPGDELRIRLARGETTATVNHPHPHP